ncbi:MAG TPA: hypothetical protein VFV67_02020 [Actinophytocola sp.]|uniref:hypothetical protein n=1 Tax=Actinophytocola sp. TaxID=1872138 RepID=UPI002DB723B0|nr:hypothetical protein [Actinophytocola sp.]HEU5469401.1 hypothetical protein [Actinophytocola sp.]
MTDMPAPVPVAELIAQRRRGRYYAGDGYLDHAEVADAWPVVWDLDAVIGANGVRTKQETATGTYGTSSWTVYHASDVQRVADAIADGTAVRQVTKHRSSCARCRMRWRLARSNHLGGT